MNDESIFLTRQKAAKVACVSLKTLDRWRAEGLQFYQRGARRKVLLTRDDIKSFLSQRDNRSE